ncbi:MAG: hypothetical protein JNL83_36320, partial [Myxococcales bacterium]|nr:hypothetical protein [Myxococcales bacterium]
IDLSPPTVTINTRPANPTNATTASFTFTASDGTTTCQIDGGAFSACTSPRSYTGLAAGSHTFVVRATDAAGNSGTAMWTWTIDVTPPTVMINTKPTNPTNLTTATFTFTVSDGTVECQLDGGSFAACTSPRSYTGLAPGSHTFVVRSTDAATNVGSDTWTWTIDNGAPVVTIVNRPNHPTNQTTATFTFTVSEGSPQCQIDGGAFTACTSPRTYTGLGAGSHTFIVRATDTANNTGSATYTWTIDLTPPTITIMGPPNPTASRNPTITFTVSEGSPQCRLDAASYAPCTSPVAYTNLADGSHTFSVTSTDAAGNPATASHSWTIDGSGPIVTFSSVPPARWPVNYYDFAWSANESATYQCSVNGGTTWVACSTPFAIPNAAAGFPVATYGANNTFSVRGRDSLGNTGAATTHTWAPVAGVVLHYPFEQGLRQNTSLLAQRAAYSPGVAGQGAAVGGWAGTALRSALSATYVGASRPLTSSAQGVYMGGMWLRVYNDAATGTLWTNVDSSNLWGHTVSLQGISVTLTVLQNGTPYTVQGRVPYNQWVHVGVRTTGPAKGLELLINGATAAHAAPPSATGFDAGQGDLRIGQVSLADIDDVRFYNTLVNACTTFVRGLVPPTGGPCVANAPAIEMDFEGGRLDETGTMTLGRTAPPWSAFTGRLGQGFTMGTHTVAVIPLQLTNVSQQQPLLGHTLSLWVRGSSTADTLFDFVRACPAVTYVGQCGLRVTWTANRTFAIFAGVPGLGATMQQSTGVPAAPLDPARTHNLVITEQRSGGVTQSLRIYVDGNLERTLTFGNGTVFSFGLDTIQSCTNTGCAIDELELWPQDLSTSLEMLCENGFDGQWDPAADRCIFTSND